jgi:2-keto-3-deoxy-6-phosphogluconate aldolase
MNIEQSQEFFDHAFGRHRAMAILRGIDEQQTMVLSQRAWDAGLALVEVPLQSPQSERALVAAVAGATRTADFVGAGTIVSVDLVERAHNTGAIFTVAPGFDLEVLTRSLELGMPHLPGIATPTEVQKAMKAGLHWLKAFPADALGAAWFSAMKGPFPHARFVATGGVSAINARKFLSAGAAAVSFGSSFAAISLHDLGAVS